MKKYLSSIVTTSMVLLASPLVSFAAGCGKNICLPSDYGFTGFSIFAGVHDIPTLIVFIIQILLSIAAITAVLFIIIGGFRYILSAGDETAAKNGRRTVTNALIGLVLIILSYVIISVIVNTFTNAYY